MTANNFLTRGALALGALFATDLLLPPVAFLGSAPAQAIVGRPATPVSYAGVARRTTRRTVAVVASTPPPPPVVVVAPPPPPPPPK